MAIAAACVLGALAVRAALVPRMAVLQPDGCYYLWMAEDLAAGRVREALSDPKHPLYPALVAATARATGAPFERAGYAVSVALGALAAAPLFFAFRRATGSEAGGAAGSLLYAAHPYLVRSGADVMSEATFLFFVALAVAAALRAIDGAPARSRAAALAGSAAGFAYLARPEGLAIAAVSAVLLAFRRAFFAAGCVAAAAAAVAAPYAIAISSRGDLALTRKKSLAALLAGPLDPSQGVPSGRPNDLRAMLVAAARGPDKGAARPGSRSRTARLAGALFEAGSRFLRVLQPLPIAFGALGIGAALAARRRPPRAAIALALFVAAFFAIAFLLRAAAGYVHNRHVEAAAALALAAAGSGAALAARRLGAWLRRPRAAAAILALGCAAVLLPKALERQFGYRAGVRAAAEALRARAGGAARFLVAGYDAAEIAYYAGGREDPIEAGSPEEVLVRARARGARFFAYTLRRRSGPPATAAEDALARLGLRPFYSADERTVETEPLSKPVVRCYRRVLWEID